ncbi:MAG TPA: serpin family protein, partial [Anaerolineaceae bacterium]|nr:serpin family protein [Anaerolineaceae bacterium]
LILALLAACAPAAQAVDVAKSTKSRITEPQVNAADMQTLVKGNNEFALALYQELRAEDGNLIYSPYSVSQALAMTYAGARGETESQMAAAMRFFLPQASLHPAFNALSLELEKRANTTTYNENNEPDTAGAFRLRIANALWGQKGFTFLPEFLDTLAQNYAAGMQLLDYAADAEAARKIINQWVFDQTEEKIKDLIPTGAVTPDTRLVLTNAIYFKAAWAYPFVASGTQPAPFYRLDGSQVEAQMMNLQERFRYLAGEGYQVVELPYVGNEMVMTLIVPDSGNFAAIDQILSAAWLDEAFSKMNSFQVNLGLPRFKFEAEFSLSDTLKAMGMPAAFEGADFSGMTGSRDLVISDVIHKAFIAVDEKGTEAAAATAVIMKETAMVVPDNTINLTIDRPFIFLIRDRTTGAILFVGRVLDPAAGQ